MFILGKDFEAGVGVEVRSGLVSEAARTLDSEISVGSGVSVGVGVGVKVGVMEAVGVGVRVGTEVGEDETER